MCILKRNCRIKFFIHWYCMIGILLKSSISRGSTNKEVDFKKKKTNKKVTIF